MLSFATWILVILGEIVICLNLLYLSFHGCTQWESHEGNVGACCLLLLQAAVAAGCCWELPPNAGEHMHVSFVNACLNCVAPEGCATTSLASLGIITILVHELHEMA